MIIIAHRGASGYLPEHTPAAKALAFAQGADFLEQDVVLTRDGVPVVLHDLYLDTVTDVAIRFPARQRADGRFHVMDFDLAELRTLRVFERFNRKTGKAVYPTRFPTGFGEFRLSTLAEEIGLILRLNARAGRRVGLYPELKRPAVHAAAGLDVAAATLAELARHPLRELGIPVFLQCFDPATLQHLRTTRAHGWPQVQLLADNAPRREADCDYDFLRSPAGLDAVATWADAIGPALHHLVRVEGGRLVSTGLAEAAHARGLQVHAYTLRADALPPGAPDHDTLLRWLCYDLRLDGIFTDFPDLAALPGIRSQRGGAGGVTPP